MPPPRQHTVIHAVPASALLSLAALAALSTVVPAAHACTHHGADTGCPAAEQPPATYLAFQQQQHADILAMFAANAAARWAAGNGTAVEAGSGSQRRRLRALAGVRRVTARHLAQQVIELATDAPTAAPTV